MSTSNYDMENVKSLEKDMRKHLKAISNVQVEFADRTEEIRQIALTAEETCSRLAGDCMKRI
jgi:septation ring formation regulator EzrA